MEQYHKINTMFKRDIEQKKKPLIYGAWATPEIEYLKDACWVGTEKVDGTNIRIIYKGATAPSDPVRFIGKTDDSQIPTKLLAVLQDKFTVDLMHSVFGATDVCLYGEGYGETIAHKVGKLYLPNEHDFILFDCLINGFYLSYEKMGAIAEQLKIKLVPIVFEGTLNSALMFVQSEQYNSRIATLPVRAEGLVLKPAVDMFSRKGERIVTKIKVKDFSNIIYPDNAKLHDKA